MNATDTIVDVLRHAPTHEAMRIAVDLAMVLESLEPRFITDVDDEDVKRAVRHAREDRLPRERASVLRDILDASGVRDHDSAQADMRYLEWKRGGRKGKKPTSNLGGMLDGFNATTDGKHPCCLLEAFELDMRGMRTWRDVRDLLPVLADAIGADRLMLPEDVEARHVAHDVEMNGGCDAE